MPTTPPTEPDTTPTAPHSTITPPPRAGASTSSDPDAPLWARVDRWNLAIVGTLIAICLAWFTWAPADRIAAGADFLVGVLSVLGVIAAVRGHLVAPRSRPSAIPSAPPPPPATPPSAAHKRRIGSIDLVLEWVLAGLAVVGFVIAVLFSHGCASTSGAGGIAAAVLAAKPVLATSCSVARRACDFVTRGCDLISPELDATAGGSAPPSAPPAPAPAPDEVAAVPAPVASSEDGAR
jgi:hypothetical protein